MGISGLEWANKETYPTDFIQNHFNWEKTDKFEVFKKKMFLTNLLWYFEALKLDMTIDDKLT